MAMMMMMKRVYLVFFPFGSGSSPIDLGICALAPGGLKEILRRWRVTERRMATDGRTDERELMRRSGAARASL